MNYCKRVCLLTGIFILLLGGCSSNGDRTLDLRQYAEVTIEGYSTAATAVVALDRSGLERDLLNLPDVKANEAASMQRLANSLSYVVSKERDIANGDEITVFISFSEDAAGEAGLRMVGSEQKLKVTGLPELERIDLFDGLSFEYEGASPCLTIHNLHTENDHPFMGSVVFKAEKESPGNYLAIGEAFTIIAGYQERKALEAGVILEESERQFVVEGVDVYLESWSELTAGEVARLRDDAAGRIAENFESSWVATLLMATGNSYYLGADTSGFFIESMELEQVYFLRAREIERFMEDRYNQAYLLFRATIQGLEQEVLYVSVSSDGLKRNADGTIAFNDKSSEVGMGHRDIESWYNHNLFSADQKYDITKTEV